MKLNVKKYGGVIGVVLGLCLATIIHGAIEAPILIWATRGAAWNPFWGFETYNDFAVFDRMTGVVQWTLGIILGYYFGKKYITRLK